MPSAENTSTQGQRASKNGNRLESVIEGIFASHGFKIVPYVEWCDSKYDGGRVLVKNVPYESIYGPSASGKSPKTEFVAKSEHFPGDMRIECKWQQSSGSVDEKFPYLYLNAALKFEEKFIALVVDGGGYTVSARNWLQEAANKRLFVPEGDNREIKVFTMGEMMSWLNKRLS